MTAAKTKAASNERGPKASEIRKDTVEIPEWNMTVEVRALSINTQISLTMSDDDDFVSRMLRGTCYDPETGKKLFSAEDTWLDDEPAGSPVEVLVEMATELSGLGVTDDEAITAGKGDS